MYGGEYYAGAEYGGTSSREQPNITTVSGSGDLLLTTRPRAAVLTSGNAVTLLLYILVFLNVV